MEEKLKQCLQEEKRGYLLVLDDVCNEDWQLWKSMESLLVRVTCSTRCRVLVTTQSHHVAEIMRASPTHELKDLLDKDARKLFESLAFNNKTWEQTLDLEDVGRRILRKCKGLPLAIKTMGYLLGSMNDKSEWELVERSEIWGLSLSQSNIMPWLLISFHHLREAAIKQCFVHCSIIIEKGQTVQQSELIQAWIAQGFIQSTTGSDMIMEDIGESYVNKLVANGLLQVFMMSNCRCLKMHDLVHDLARYISKGTIWIPRDAPDLHTATKAQHVRICGEADLEFVYNLPKDKTLSKLCTLICTRATLSVDFAAQTKFLRDLRLIDCGLWEVPSSIGRLKHLRLLSLHLQEMQKLRNWVQPSGCDVFPCLMALRIKDCPLLVSAPTCFPYLSHLFISNIRSGAAVRMILTTTIHLYELDISGVEDLTSLSHLQLKGKSFTTLRISDCRRLVELYPPPTLQSTTDTEGLLSLEGLKIEGCPNLGTTHGLETCVSLRRLSLRGNSNLELIPDLRNLSLLSWLELVDCSRQTSIPEWLSCLPSLEELEIGGFNEELVQLDGSAHLPMGLKRLTLKGWPNLKSLPTELQRLNLLERLTIREFQGIETLPEWLGYLSSLLFLGIEDCNKLKYMPSPHAMRRLNCFCRLNIIGCSILEKRCIKDGGEEGHKISHLSI
ncbi:hypothetical protein V2J09_008085 [Rumex salicifolius]